MNIKSYRVFREHISQKEHVYSKDHSLKIAVSLNFLFTLFHRLGPWYRIHLHPYLGLNLGCTSIFNFLQTYQTQQCSTALCQLWYFAPWISLLYWYSRWMLRISFHLTPSSMAVTKPTPVWSHWKLTYAFTQGRRQNCTGFPTPRKCTTLNIRPKVI